MAEGVLRARFGHQLAGGVLQSLRHADAAVAEALAPSRRRLPRNFASSNAISGNSSTSGIGVAASSAMPDRRGDPAGVAAHHLEHEHLGRGLRHRRDVERRFAHRRRDVLRDRAETGTVVGHREIVVDGLRHVHGDERIAQSLRDLRHLEAGVGRVVAAVVEEVADVVRAEHLDQPLVLRAILLEALELVAARAERARRRVLQRRDRARASPGSVSIRSSVSAPMMPLRPA